MAQWSKGLFLEGPDNFLGPKSCFMFAVFVFKMKVSIILKMIQWSFSQRTNKTKLTS